MAAGAGPTFPPKSRRSLVAPSIQSANQALFQTTSVQQKAFIPDTAP
jgi:hypothetical protein